MKSRVKVLVCDSVPDEGIKELVSAGFKVDVIPDISNEKLRNIVSDYDALIVRGRTKITKEIIEAAEKLKAIGRTGVGLDNIDVETAKKRGISVFNTPKAPAVAVAELAMGLIISLARNIPMADRTMKEGKWNKKGFKGCQLRGQTLGVIGLGNIGERIAKIAKAFGMRILITKRTSPSPELLRELDAEFFSIDDLSNFLQKSDVISINIPLTAQTHHMIGAKEIQLMTDGAFLVNTSRGEIVDEKALLEALQSGKLRGAALDVYEDEPTRNLQLIRLPNVICTPHIGGQTLESQRAASITLGKKLVKLLKND